MLRINEILDSGFRRKDGSTINQSFLRVKYALTPFVRSSPALFFALLQVYQPGRYMVRTDERMTHE
jgi:hypothetical protein